MVVGDAPLRVHLQGNPLPELPEYKYGRILVGYFRQQAEHRNAKTWTPQRFLRVLVGVLSSDYTKLPNPPPPRENGNWLDQINS